MAIEMRTRLEKLADKAFTAGQFSLAAAASAAARDPSDPDHRINVVGALHEVGKLRNSLEPYWRAWRLDEHGWIVRCFDRLYSNDHDYWALAGLLGCPTDVCRDVLEGADFVRRSLRFYSRYDLPEVHVAVYTRERVADVWAPVFEIGWDTDSGEVVDVARWRAIAWKRTAVVRGSVVGQGSGSLYLRARLPHGSWRIVDDTFELRDEWVVPRNRTL